MNISFPYTFNFKSILSLIICIVLSSVALHSQSYKTQLALDAGAKINAIVKRGDSGFIMSSYQENKYGGKNSTNIRINYFDKSLKQKWEYIVPHGANQKEDFFVASEATPYIYWMSSRYDKEMLDNGKSRERIISIQRFNSKGEVEQFKTGILESKKEVELIHIYSDKDNLYYFSLKPAEYKKSKMVSPEVMYMYTLPHTSQRFTKTTINPELPLDGEYSLIEAQMGLIGHTDSLIYISQKRIQIQSNKMEITVFAINKAGEMVSSFKIEPGIEGFYSPHRTDFNWENNGEVHFGKDFLYAREEYKANANSMVSIDLDKINNRLIVYGLASKQNDQFAGMSHEIKSIFLQTYSLDGRHLSTTDYDIDNNPANCLILGKRGSAWQKNLNFTILSKDVFKLDFHYTMGDITTYYLGSKRIIEGYRNDNFYRDSKGFWVDCNLWDEMRFELLALPKYSIPSYSQYLKKINNDGGSALNDYSSIGFTNCNILLKYNEEANKTFIDLLCFE